jgi:hypothetical protein
VQDRLVTMRGPSGVVLGSTGALTQDDIDAVNLMYP